MGVLWMMLVWRTIDWEGGVTLLLLPFLPGEKMRRRETGVCVPVSVSYARHA